MVKRGSTTYMAKVLMKEAGGNSPYSDPSGDGSPRSASRNNSPFRQQAIQEGKLRGGFDSVIQADSDSKRFFKENLLTLNF